MYDNNWLKNENLSAVIVYGNGLSIHQDLADSVQQQVIETVPHLLPDNEYTLKVICGKDYWGLLSKGEQRTVGQYISFLVTGEDLPIVSVLGKHEYPKLYKLR